MARQATVKHIRKAGAFTSGQLSAGEIGVNTTDDLLEFSPDGTYVVPIDPEGAAAAAVTASKPSTMGVVVHGATAGTARPAGYTVVTWIGSATPTNAATNDLWVQTA